jgi:hypothetical protein
MSTPPYFACSWTIVTTLYCFLVKFIYVVIWIIASSYMVYVQDIHLSSRPCPSNCIEPSPIFGVIIYFVLSKKVKLHKTAQQGAHMVLVQV